MAKNTHLTLSDRIAIEVDLREQKSFSAIATELGKDPTTISKEVRSHVKLKQAGGYNPCVIRKDCKHYGDVCSPCKFPYGKTCHTCFKAKCFETCPDFKRAQCSKLAKPPYVCNGCQQRQACKLERHLYEAKFAQKEYEATRSESRQGFAVTPTELDRIDRIISPLIKQGQSIHQICVNNADEIMLDERTIYNYVDAGLLSVGNIDLPRKVHYKVRKKKPSVRVDKHCHLGRTYEDFLEYTAANPDILCFSVEQAKAFKILAGYHQYFAVRKAVEKAKVATTTDGKGGVFWHTQGSGKSLSMVFYAHLLQEALDSPTIVVMTDRIDLDDQLYSQFAKCAAFLRQTPVQAESKVHLKKLLEGRTANGIIFTTMFKFEESEEPLSTRRNIVVMADEAHRGQYGMDERIVMSENEQGETEARVVVGNARIIRDALPNATFIGFTGTPVSSKDRNTREVFGDYIDIYDMTQAVEDGATRPVYYESRIIHLKLDENTLKLIDSTYDVLEQQADAATIDKSKKMLGQMESVLGAESTIKSLCDDIVTHYENNRAGLLTGKAMIVAYSRPIAMKIYRRILELRPDWKEKVGVVMTGGNNDPEDWKEIIGTKSHKEELARKFKDNNDPMKIAIVVDMWLTGFDVPSMATMYVYKPMHGYNLMQAIARVNRVFKDKEGGLVVDYVGIASALKAAMNEYTARDRSKYGDMDIAKTAYPKFQEKLQVCRDLFHGFDYSGFIGGSPLVMAQLISGGANFVLDPKDQQRKELYLKEAMLMKQAMSLCSSLTTEQERREAAYFEAVRSTVVKLTYGGNGGKPLSLKEINAQINELLKASVQSEGVISLFDSRKVGENFSLFDPAVLDEISRMKQKNIAVEILKKLLAERVSLYKRTNLVQSQKFSEMITRIMNAYYNGHIDNEKTIEKLLEAAKKVIEAYQAGDNLGLTQEELAFYDALTKPQAIKDFYENDVLVQMTRELTEMLRKNRTIDWQKKETARATMRKMVKRLLKKYKYSPDEYEDAIDTVISQCEMWTDNN